jgi:hypothetical protein
MTGEGYGTAMEVRGQRADDRGQKAAGSKSNRQLVK